MINTDRNTMISIINFEDKHAADFRQLNVAWLDKFNLMESHDMEVLDDPRGTILDGGGYIYLAASGEEIIGSAALMKAGEGLYELVKMAVAPTYQGKGISKLLIEKCIDKAKETGAVKLFLYSNSQLQTALNLYTRYGFRHVTAVDSPFVTADVKMELEL